MLHPDDVTQLPDGRIHATIDPTHLHVPAGTARVGIDPVVLDAPRTGFRLSGLHVIYLEAEIPRRIDASELEHAVVPISGGAVHLAVDGGDPVTLVAEHQAEPRDRGEILRR